MCTVAFEKILFRLSSTVHPIASLLSLLDAAHPLHVPLPNHYKRSQGSCTPLPRTCLASSTSGRVILGHSARRPSTEPTASVFCHSQVPQDRFLSLRCVLGTDMLGRLWHQPSLSLFCSSWSWSLNDAISSFAASTVADFERTIPTLSAVGGAEALGTGGSDVLTSLPEKSPSLRFSTLLCQDPQCAAPERPGNIETAFHLGSVHRYGRQ